MPNNQVNPTRSQRANLRKNLAQSFDTNELRDLCFDLGIQDENLPDTLAGMARELVQHCERHGTMPELLDRCRQERPGVEWPQLPVEPLPMSPTKDSDHSTQQIASSTEKAKISSDYSYTEPPVPARVRRTGQVMIGLLVADIVLALVLTWRLFGNEPNMLAYIQAMTGVLALVLQVIGLFVALRVRHFAWQDIPTEIGKRTWVWGSIIGMTIVLVSFLVAPMINLFPMPSAPTSGSLATASPSVLPMPTPSLTIDGLRDGAVVDHHQTVQAHCTGMPSGWHLWGVTHKQDGSYYFHGPTDAPTVDGKCSLDSYFGDRTYGIGSKYQFFGIALQADSQVERELIKRLPGSLDPLPTEGLFRSEPITVTRIGPVDRWYADYWASKEMTGAVRFSEDILNRYLFKDWGNGSPAEGIPGDGWSGRFVRRVNFPNNGPYRFYAERDDGVRVWLDDKLVIDAWTDGALAREAKTITLTQGYHEIAVDFYDIWQQAWLGFWYEGPEPALTPLPVSDSYWQVAYYPNREFKNDPTSYDYPRSDYLDLNWSDTRGAPIGSPWATEILTDNFSTHSTREVVFKEGIYQFEISGDDGVKLRIDDQVLFEEGEAWKNCTPCRVRVDLTEGKHVLGVEQWETVGNARVSLKWERVSPIWETFSNPYAVQAMAVDDQYVWTGSKGGLVRWDKHRLSSYEVLHPEDGVPDNQVAALFKDRNGVLWVGTGESYDQGGSGLGRYDGKWRTLTTKDGLCDNAVFDIFQDRDGSLWIGTGYGLNHYDERSGKWECYHSDDGPGSSYPSPIHRDRKGNLWVGAGGVGISVMQTNGIWKTYKFDEIGIKDQWGIGSVAEDTRGNLWFGSWGGVARFDGQHWKTFKEGDGLPSDAVLALAADEAGNVWFGTPDGLARYNGTTWQTFTTTHGLASNSITGLVIDRDGVLWVGHDDGSGISSFDGKRWVSSPPPQGTSLPTRITTIYQDRDQRFWFGTGFPPTKSGDGVRTFDGNKWEAFSKPDCLEHGYIDVIFQDKDGNMWFGYDTAGGGVTYVDSKSCRTFTKSDGLAGNEVDDIIQDRDGNLWFATSDGGLSRYDGKSWQTFNKDNSRLPTNDLNRIYQDRNGDFWFGTRQNGVVHYDGKNWEVLTSKDGLASNWVTDIVEDAEGALWFGTDDGGVSRYDLKKKEWQTFDRDNGSLLSDGVYAVRVDKSGWLWVGTTKGVNCYTGRRWLSYTPVDGLASRRVHAIWEDRQGNMWLGTGGGTSRLRFVTASGGN